ncbi:hypothetical protein [Paracoccus shanxieyensis]|uniref:Uncharacterized protein n=1 Tax=Paracoccus shanxieyensis TaxID=2675752 RepID=A0A6L6J0I7_9RHOB|nr:hypothetical protein [Paracoccus shanxieyensis]MTH66316.1 hypothetical protein [Paracoccus shanxieyensis]MTH89075.1 hypothetical protein [Paracoccus shanxieyensis]
MIRNIFGGIAAKFFYFIFILVALHAGSAIAQSDVVNIKLVKLNPEGGAILAESDPLWEGVSQTYLLIEDRYIVLSDSGSIDVGGCGDIQGCRKNFTGELRISAPPGWAIVPGSARYQRQTSKTYFRSNPNDRPSFDVNTEEMSAQSTVISAWVVFGCERDGRMGGGGCDARANLTGIAVKLE